MALLQRKKDARLEMLLQQTAEFLDRIGSMVQLEKDRAVRRALCDERVEAVADTAR